MSARLALAALLAGIATALLMGCGVDTRDSGTPTDTGPGATTTGGATTVDTAAQARLPRRPSGVVEVRGPAQGSLTALATTGVAGVRVNYAGEGEEQGFADLCAGRIDVLDTSREITRAERRRCETNGVDLADPLRIASDAVVIATRNESDVGGDCLRRTTVDDIFRAGSPISNWSQVGFFDIPLRATGPPAQAPAFQFFAQTVLGVASNASLADVRSDYIVHTTDDGVRNEVTGDARRQRIVARYLPRLRELQRQRDLEFGLFVDAAIAEARDRVLAEIDSENQRRAASGLVLSEEQKLLIEQTNRARVERATERAQRRAEEEFSFPRLELLRQRARRALARAAVPGTVGIFRFSYYELYEEQLRPMEIWDPERAAAVLGEMQGVRVERSAATAPPTETTAPPTETTAPPTETTAPPTETTTGAAQDAAAAVDPDQTPWCVFPSQTTITNDSYPLSRPLLLYVAKHNLDREEVRGWLLNYLDRAQALATDQRLVPIPDTTLRANRDIVNQTQTGSATTATVPAPAPPGISTTPTTTAPAATTTTAPRTPPATPTTSATTP